MHNSTNTNTHLLIYPLSSSGHIIPLLDLTHHLLRRGLTITVIISAANLPLLHPLLSSHPSSLHQLLLPDPAVNPSVHPLIARLIATHKLFDPIVRWFQSHPSPPAAIISDFLLGWTGELASHLGIRRLVFSTSGALGSSIFQTLCRDVPRINAGKVAGDEDCLFSFPEIPNSPEFPLWQLSYITLLYKKGEPELEFFRNGILANMTSWGIVYNTFEEFEGVYIDEFLTKMVLFENIFTKIVFFQTYLPK